MCAFIHGFTPYFYIERHPSWGLEEVEELRKDLCVSGGGGEGRARCV